MQMFMFEAVITNVSEWRSILAAIGNIVEDAMFICNADEVTFRGMDAAHVALLDVSFPKRSFESLKADASMFGIKIEDFKNVLAAASADDKVTLSIEGKDKLSITFSGSLDMKYNLKLLEGREVNTPVPKIEAVSKIKISPDALTRVMIQRSVLEKRHQVEPRVLHPAECYLICITYEHGIFYDISDRCKNRSPLANICDYCLKHEHLHFCIAY